MKQFIAVLIIFAIINESSSHQHAKTPSKPEWPYEFDAAFGMSALPTQSTPGIVNTTSHIYYNWDEVESTLIDYPGFCLPFFPTWKYPCQLIFNPVGTYFLQPAVGLECCLLFPGIGSVPPAFLTPFNFSGFTPLAVDHSGVPHITNFWVAGGFNYWTDTTTGLDIQFEDGGAILWNWSPLNDVPQPASIFSLPSGQNCNASCPSSFLEKEISDPYISLARLFNTQF